MKRRDFLGLAVVTTILLPLRAIAAVWNKAAFGATNVDGAAKGLAVNNEIPSDKIEIIAPSHAENGAIVQVEVTSHIPNTEAIAVLVENNPTALIANTMFSNGVQPYLVTRIKMAKTSDIKIIVKAGNQYFTASKRVEVLKDGCGGSGRVDKNFKSSMKMRARLEKEPNKAGVAIIKAIITHPMHTGAGKDMADQLIPAHFIQLISILHNDKPIVEMQLGTGISKNPYLTFRLNGAKVDDKVTVVWHDNFGNAATGDIAVIQG